MLLELTNYVCASYTEYQLVNVVNTGNLVGRQAGKHLLLLFLSNHFVKMFLCFSK